jgi:hypothetical protein
VQAPNDGLRAHFRNKVQICLAHLKGISAVEASGNALDNREAGQRPGICCEETSLRTLTRTNGWGGGGGGNRGQN